MAIITQEARIEAYATFKLTESELAALDALSGYGTDAFLKIFYEHMGRGYLEKHEIGLRTLFSAVRDKVPYILSCAESARKVFNKEQGEG